MTQDRIAALFFELFEGLPRQGPGDAASTKRALALVPGVSDTTRVLDVGCGTGTQTLVLAQHSPARLIAIDSHAPFVEALARRAHALGLGDRVDARVGDMTRLEFPAARFDAIWCEGAIYVVGFESGLREWRRLLAPGGYIALTEVCWTAAPRAPECEAFWAQEYPAIREPPALLDAIDACGYEPIAHFPLPPTAWWNDYYRPLQQKLIAFRDLHRDDPDAQGLADQVQREIDMWHAHSSAYAYYFFVMRAR